MQGSLQSNGAVVAKSLADQFTSFLTATFQTEAVRGLVSRWLRKTYGTEIERQEVKFNMNFMPDADTIAYLENAVFENVKGITAELQSRMQRELSQGLAAGENKAQLRRRLANIFKGNNPTRFRFETRIETIERTEGARAQNYAQLDTAKQLPFAAKKRLDVLMDDRTSDICRAMHKKYGTDKQAIALNKPFKVTGVKVGKNKVSVSEMAPPFHPNCRTGVVTVIQEEESEED